MEVYLDGSENPSRLKVMQTVTPAPQPQDDVLLREGDITVTSARIEINNTSYSMKYVSTMTLAESHPPRKEAKMTLVLVGVAIVALIIYLINGTVGVTGFVSLFTVAALAGSVGAFILWFTPSNYSLDLTLINGEAIQINSQSETYIQKIHQAITTGVSLNRQDPIGSSPQLVKPKETVAEAEDY